MRNRVAKFQIILIILIAFAAGYFFGVNKVTFDWKGYAPSVKVVNKEPPASISGVDFSQFWLTWQKLEANYYDKTKLDPEKMVNSAISGMVQSLGDPFTVYLPPVQNDNFKQTMAGKLFTGIGAELGMKDKNIIVIAPLEGSPAEKSGIRAGDFILKVDDLSTAGWTLTQAVEKIRGPKETQIVLQVLHKDETTPKSIKITRDVITVKSVAGWVKEVSQIDKIKIDKNEKGSIAYIRLSQFGDNTNKDWTNLINELNLKITETKDFKGIILDLRNNPGGYLTDAVFIASEFLPNGATVVSCTPRACREENGVSKNTLIVGDSGDRSSGLFVARSLVILINEGSASAAEIVAGAMRDNRQIKLIGEKSFGKGTVQEAEDLGNGAGLHVTIAKWITPKGTWVNGTGLMPDIKVDLNLKDPSRDTQLEKAVVELLK
jgi:carboxyl-terminal processing protease